MAKQLDTLIERLQQPGIYHHAVENLTVIETHISWVVLTGPYAYKIKKPLNLGFLDFSTLDKRRHYCDEELRINRRLAPEIYLEVVPITGSTAQPHLGGTGTPIEYAVKMIQFPQQTRLDYCLQRGELSPKRVEDLAGKVAAFHQKVAIAPRDSPYGAPEAIEQPALENFQQMEIFLKEAEDQKKLACLRRWTEEKWQQLQPEFTDRQKAGFVRECHGDLHLGNIALREDQFIIFDGIEFNENLRWIDVMNELAFLLMDLEKRGRPDLAHRCLNSYLERSGDYPGLAVLAYYQVYRALVRAKVTAIRLGQMPPDIQAIKEHCRDYLNLALHYIQPARPFLLITHGFSGSGKTTLSQPLIERFGIIHLRSDIERKRRHGLQPRNRYNKGIGIGMYSPASTHETYQHLQQLAQAVLKAGYPLIVDGAFLKQQQRQIFQDLANKLGIPFTILDFHCDPRLLPQRIRERQHKNQDASDADLAVLEHQQATHEPLTKAEQAITLAIDTSQAEAMETVIQQLQVLTGEKTLKAE
ncbi:AAA family ATPase [Nitrosococcus watsonii]|uniref:Aminoglycoside phosphotransferase n=1 Tax=Nitrosococcus watsoni (strain C-113) TaxID=105559 RepID=D8KAR3_NITWC|nr:bifunctional aminoglycoside phosphotransferase/ATP-binding protein [Nitrosococcus watsonii]ADJ29490.1 aminoglycoside phosphotransferase [Nitrosococcus watsonii C-113]